MDDRISETRIVPRICRRVKKLFIFIVFIFWSSLAQADPMSLRIRDMNTTAIVSTQMWIQCDSVQSPNSDGTQNIYTNKCVVRWKVGTTNYCTRVSPFDFFSKIMSVKR